jgi:ABC-type glycerol-3-phosphate transport system substrate-binding protein
METKIMRIMLLVAALALGLAACAGSDVGSAQSQASPFLLNNTK